MHKENTHLSPVTCCNHWQNKDDIKKIKTVFLPGKLCDHRLWTYIIEELSDIIEPIFIDLRTQNTLEEMLDTIAKSCKENFLLVGFSMGGYIAQEFSLRHPKRLLGLVLIGSSADAYSSKEIEYQQRIMENVRKFGYKGIPDSTMQNLIHRCSYNNIELISLIKNMAIESGSKALLSQYSATINRRSRLEYIPQINCPAIVIGSDEDQIVSIERIKEMALNMKADFHVITKCGHMIPLEKPKKLCDIIREWFKDNKPLL